MARERVMIAVGCVLVVALAVLATGGDGLHSVLTQLRGE